MRVALVLTLILVSSFVLAGCTSKTDTTNTGTVKTTVTGTKTITNTRTTTLSNTTTQTPNVAPVLKFKISSNGTVQNFTFVNPTTHLKGSLTFDATGTVDPDADGLSGIALSVTDSNKTYPAGTLFSNGQFTPVTYTFDRPGPVNVTVSALDNRGDITTLETHVYVDQISTIVTPIFKTGAADARKASDCVGPFPASADLLNQGIVDKGKFDTKKTTTFAVATIVDGAGEIALCAPDATAISGEDSAAVTSNAGTVFTDTTGTSSFYVLSLASALSSNSALTIQVVTHYEPQPAAAPAA